MKAFLISLLFLLFTVFGAHALPPLYPLLTAESVNQLKVQLAKSAADTNRVNLLLRLGEDLILKYEELDGDIDPMASVYSQQAAQLSGQLNYTNGRIRSMYCAGRILAYANNAQGVGLLQKGVELSAQLHDKRLEALGWCYLAGIYEPYVGIPTQGEYKDLPKKIAYYEKAALLYRQAGDKVDEAFMLQMLAEMHGFAKDFAQSKRELQKAISLYKAGGYKNLQYTYWLLGGTNETLGNYQAAIRYALAAIENAKALKDTTRLGLYYWDIATIYKDLNRPTESILYFKKALPTYKQKGSYFSIKKTEAFYTVITAGEIAMHMIRQRKPEQARTFFIETTKPFISDEKYITMQYYAYLAYCYQAVKQNDLAEKKYLQAIGKAEMPGIDIGFKGGLYQAISTFYVATHRFDKAEYYLNKVLHDKELGEGLLRLANIQLILYKVDSARKNYPSAIVHYSRYKALNDSVFNVTKAKQISDLQIQYDTKEKEQSIVLLTKQAQAQQARIQKREFQRNAFLAGAVMLTLLLCVSYNRYRLKQRSNQLLEVKQQELEAQQQEINLKNQALEVVVGEKEELLVEKEWMLKEIHHRVKNNLQVISSLLNSQSSYLHDSTALAALREGQNRVQAMALIHQKLYQSDNLARVDMQAYIREILDNLLESFDRLGTVQGRVEVAAVELEVALATPLGLLINEAVTNSLKYAFPNNRCGTITVGLAKLESQGFLLTIADDGVGLPSDFDPAKSRSLGLTIIQGMSRQIHGTLSFVEASGVTLRLQFEGIKKDAQTATVPTSLA